LKSFTGCVSTWLRNRLRTRANIYAV